MIFIDNPFIILHLKFYNYVRCFNLFEKFKRIDAESNRVSEFSAILDTAHI